MRFTWEGLLAAGVRCVYQTTGWRPSDETLCRMGHRAPGFHRLPLPMHDGRWMYLDLRNPVSLPYLLEGDFPCEKIETKLVQKLIKPGDTAIDVGANLGWYTTLLCREIGPKGEVHAIEPNRDAARLLKALKKWHPALEVHAIALGEKEQRTDFHIPENWISASLGEIDGPTRKQHTKVVPLDVFLQKDEVHEVDFIKLDAEGAEKQVLKGASATLNNRKPPIWLLELSTKEAARFGHHPSELLEAFYRVQSTEYIGYIIDPENCRLQPMQLPEWDDFWLNALLIPKTRQHRIPKNWLETPATSG
ncbi:MAG: FkbM family methyltransferase [Planctomycetes bacterium]|nr:FkbM family methyltransferase [Planctomycetota bacterium]